MPFSGAGTGIQNADDVFFSSVGDGETLQYNSATSKWTNADTAVEWNNVSNKPSGYTPSAHSHAISDTTSLQTELNSRPTSTTISQIWTGNQSSYDAIPAKDSSILYLITG